VGGGEETITPKPPEVPRVQVTAVEYKFTLSRTVVPAGKVILEFDNKGQDEHNLNVLSGGGELSGSFANEQSGGVTQEALDLKPGSYTLFCSLPEHEAKGMKATLVVE
jgi:plastocyanin